MTEQPENPLDPKEWKETHLFDNDPNNNPTLGSAYNLHVVSTLTATFIALPIYLTLFTILIIRDNANIPQPSSLTTALTTGAIFLLAGLLTRPLINKTYQHSLTLANNPHINTNNYTWKDHLATTITPVTDTSIPYHRKQLKSFHRTSFKDTLPPLTPSVSPHFDTITILLGALLAVTFVTALTVTSIIIGPNAFTILASIVVIYFLFPITQEEPLVIEPTPDLTDPDNIPHDGKVFYWGPSAIPSHNIMPPPTPPTPLIRLTASSSNDTNPATSPASTEPTTPTPPPDPALTETKHTLRIFLVIFAATVAILAITTATGILNLAGAIFGLITVSVLLVIAAIYSYFASILTTDPTIGTSFQRTPSNDTTKEQP